MIENSAMIENAEPVADTKIVLATLNARYIHSAFGLRYLQANLGDLEQHSVIQEYTLDSKPEDVVEQILACQPEIVGFGVYIWNVVQTEPIVALLKAIAPDLKIVLGGPEVSYEWQDQRIVGLADHVITGWGERSFAGLCEKLLAGDTPDEKVIKGEQAKLSDINMPYYLYNDDDIKHRVLYVEASRGCPFKCEFCLSALDKTAWPFDLELFLEQMDKLYKRGARHFKFVDRTFNLKVKNSLRILQFFLDRMDEQLFLHFEVIPDHLPEDLKEMITRFPAGSLQFEIGIQTFNPKVQALISRRQNNDQAKQNLQWIRESSQAYIHADLIFGLPEENISSFEDSFNQLYALRPHEIQVGILKRLKGSPIVRHTQQYQLVFNPNPPFNILSNDQADYTTIQQVNRFARYWGLIGNSGRFKHSLALLLGDEPFARFMRLTDCMYKRTGQTHKISLLRLYDLVFDIAVEDLGVDKQLIEKTINEDFSASGLKSVPRCLSGLGIKKKQGGANDQTNKHNIRQSRH